METTFQTPKIVEACGALQSSRFAQVLSVISAIPVSGNGEIFSIKSCRSLRRKVHLPTTIYTKLSIQKKKSNHTRLRHKIRSKTHRNPKIIPPTKPQDFPLKNQNNASNANTKTKYINQSTKAPPFHPVWPRPNLLGPVLGSDGLPGRMVQCLITMVTCCPLRIGLWDPFHTWQFTWFIFMGLIPSPRIPTKSWESHQTQLENPPNTPVVPQKMWGVKKIQPLNGGEP